MIIADTCALIFDALQPAQLSKKALQCLNSADKKHELCCCDISLWEIAMLIEKGRLDPGTTTQEFLDCIIAARSLNIIPINPEIATLASDTSLFMHADPADRLIAATSIHYAATLVTCDMKLQKIPQVSTLW